jgi:20S proteasome alpha/beta subunit
MTEAQREKLQEILEQTWRRDQSADEAFDLIEDLMYEVQADAKREVE